MEMDTETFLVLVEKRPALYNYSLKEYHNKDLVEKLWEEIANEIGLKVTDCKKKWFSLRSSYNRYLRDVKKISNGLAVSKKKKWYLADAMKFLKDFVTHHKKSTSKKEIDEDPLGTVYVKEENVTIEDDASSQSISDDSPLPSPTLSKSKKLKMTSGAVAGPMIELLENRTGVAKESFQHDRGSINMFLESLSQDVEKLTPRRQRYFKEKTLIMLNRLLDEQDDEKKK